jgi:hypothetical protein
MIELQIQQQQGAILKLWRLSLAPPHPEPFGTTVPAKRMSSVHWSLPLSSVRSHNIYPRRFGRSSEWKQMGPGGSRRRAVWKLEVAVLSATLRDYGRFGVFVLNGGIAGKEHVVPKDWFSEAGTHKKVRGSLVDYGYMWWILDPGSPSVHHSAFAALGIFGQWIYINPKENVVIVVWSARPKPTGANTDQ